MTNAKLFDATLKYGATAFFMATIWIAFQAGHSAQNLIMQGAVSVILSLVITCGLIGTDVAHPDRDKQIFFISLPIMSLACLLFAKAIQI